MNQSGQVGRFPSKYRAIEKVSKSPVNPALFLSASYQLTIGSGFLEFHPSLTHAENVGLAAASRVAGLCRIGEGSRVHGNRIQNSVKGNPVPKITFGTIYFTRVP